jgi:hypothetical protein
MSAEYIDIFMHEHATSGEFFYADIVGIHFEHSIDELLRSFDDRSSVLWDGLEEQIQAIWPDCAQEIARACIGCEDGEFFVEGFKVLENLTREEVKEQIFERTEP